MAQDTSPMSDIPMLAAVQQALRNRRQSEWERIGREVGVPFSTIQKIVYGTTTNPTINTLQPLYDYVQAEQRAAV